MHRALVCAMLCNACGGGGGAPARAPQVCDAPQVVLSAADVEAVVRAAAGALDEPMTIAVADRAGRVLGIFSKTGAAVTAEGNFGRVVDSAELAVSLARTGAFFSSNQARLTSRTVRFISGIHFPPGIPNTPNAALYGIENTNRGCDLNVAFNPGHDVPPSRGLNALPCDAFATGGCGLGIATGKSDVHDSDSGAVNPAGVPIFKNGQLAGGIGVSGVAPAHAEFGAFAGSVPNAGFGLRAPEPGTIFLDGVQLPPAAPPARPSGTTAGTTDGTWIQPAIDGAPAADCWLAGPSASAELSAVDVERIVQQGIESANHTRAAIRLPLGSSARMALAVGDLNGNILGLYRMPDSTVFSIDVAVAKARNVVYFSGPARLPQELTDVPMGTAVTNRTINFGSQPLYPPGIDAEDVPTEGPFFPLYLSDVGHPCSQGAQPATMNQNGIVFFAGSVPLYANGRLIGGLGISGDGVEQDDVVAAAGAQGFEAPAAIRADQVFVRGVRLPYLKFNRNPDVP